MLWKPQISQSLNQDALEIALIECSADSSPPTKDDIIDDIRVGLRQAKAGEGRPARQVLQEIRDELAADADNR